MRVRQLIEGSTYSAEALEVIFKAYDSTWAAVSHLFPDDQDAARERVAHAVLIVAQPDSRDAEQLKAEAMRILGFALSGHSGGDQLSAVSVADKR
ncbi:MAG: hypothetical protein WC829_03990 [Hyphomicrobium sp.]|jgi:hypothetical protein